MPVYLSDEEAGAAMQTFKTSAEKRLADLELRLAAAHTIIDNFTWSCKQAHGIHQHGDISCDLCRQGQRFLDHD